MEVQWEEQWSLLGENNWKSWQRQTVKLLLNQNFLLEGRYWLSMMRSKIKLVSKLNFYGSLATEQTEQITENCWFPKEKIFMFMKNIGMKQDQIGL